MLSRQRYVGVVSQLWGKTALVRPRLGDPGQVMVQFDELHLQEARGWWQFAESDLKPLPTSSRVSELGRHWAFRVADDRGPQHSDTLLIWGEKPETGSHLVSPRRGYTHHGIYVGDGKVVHYAGLTHGRFRGRIEEVSLAQFADGRSVWTRNSHLPAFVPQEVVRRARSRVGENRYRILRNNCEHFCEWCLRGESRSYQVERFLASRPALGLMLGLTSAGVIGR